MDDLMHLWFGAGVLAGGTAGLAVGWFISDVIHEWRIGDLTPEDVAAREEDMRRARMREWRLIRYELRRQIVRGCAAAIDGIARVLHGTGLMSPHV